MSQLTKKAIENSFIKLLNAKPLDKITVKDIVEDCGINRNTFYYHFSDINDVTRFAINSQISNVVQTGISSASWASGFIEGARFALENRRAVYHIYNSGSRRVLDEYLNTVAYEVMSRFVELKAAQTKASESDKALIVQFYQAALVGMVHNWLESGMEQEPENVIRRLEKLLNGAILNSLKISEGNK